MDLRLYFLNKTVFLSLKIVFVLANSLDTYEMLNNATSHLGLQSSLFAKVLI